MSAILRWARIDDAEDIYELVQKTILTIYPHYYPLGVVSFFSELHSQENISRDLEDPRVQIFVVEEEGQVIGTGTCLENHITRVFVDPMFQRLGYGSQIMQTLEEFVARRFEYVEIDSSLSAALMYEKLGYQTMKHERIEVDGGDFLVYEVMRKNV